MAVVYHWKHGWIPLDHEAALSKSKGNREAASKMMADAPHATGIKSRQDVAKAVRDLPNVPASHRAEAHSQLHAAATEHKSTDLLPQAGSFAIPRELDPGEVKAGDTITMPGLSGPKRYTVQKSYSPKSDGTVNVDVLDANGRELHLTLPGHSKVKVTHRK